MSFLGLGASQSNAKSESTNSAFSDINDNATVNNFQHVGTGKKSNVSISVLDGGAISKAFDFAGAQSSNAYDFSRDVAKSAAGSVSEAVKAVSESARTETENIFINLQKYALYGALIWGAVKILRGSK